ncbi:MAG: ATP-binding protein [Planctomycetota bacterium]|nr:MAG: ATP-binding protein [Planctomycetota bacterium]
MASRAPITRTVAVPSKPPAIVGVCRRILSEIEAYGFDQEDLFAVHLAIEEAFINAIKHGNKMDANKEVKIDYSVNPDKIEIFMTDLGDGFDPNSVPDPRRGENLYKTEGRGLLLMRSYMDVIEFNNQGNRVRMVRYKEKPRLTETHRKA